IQKRGLAADLCRCVWGTGGLYDRAGRGGVGGGPAGAVDAAAGGEPRGTPVVVGGGVGAARRVLALRTRRGDAPHLLGLAGPARWNFAGTAWRLWPPPAVDR